MTQFTFKSKFILFQLSVFLTFFLDIKYCLQINAVDYPHTKVQQRINFEKKMIKDLVCIKYLVKNIVVRLMFKRTHLYYFFIPLYIRSFFFVMTFIK